MFNQIPPLNGYDFVNYDIYNVTKNPNAISSNAIYQLDFNTESSISVKKLKLVQTPNFKITVRLLLL